MSDKELVVAFKVMGLKNFFSEKLIFKHDLRFDRIEIKKHFKQIKNWGYRYSIDYFLGSIIQLENPTSQNVFYRTRLEIQYLIFSFLKSVLSSLKFDKPHTLVEKTNNWYKLYQLIGMLRSNWLFDNLEKTRFWVLQAKKYKRENHQMGTISKLYK
jgi:hypothetical protein